MPKFEILSPKNTKKSSAKAKIFEKLHKACDSILTNSYQGNCEWLIIFGWGASVHQQAIRAHRAKGKPVLILDYGYFNNNNKERVRFSVNDLFPDKQLQFAEDDTRFKKFCSGIKDVHKKDGPILLIELTPKSIIGFHYPNNYNWEEQQVTKIKAAYPKHKIIFRPKRVTGKHVSGTVKVHQGDIQQLLNGASLAVMHHSNVAIDCALSGIPCVTQKGIGAGCYPSTITGQQPSYEQRLKFLQQVSWFTWELDEIPEMIKFATEIWEKIK